MGGFDKTMLKGASTTENALELFDQLESVDMDYMIGKWKGFEFPTNHFLDGLLEASGWYGKAFYDQDKVHPLLFYKANKKGVFAINPGLLPIRLLRYPIPKNQLLRNSLLAAKLLLQTKKYKARLRMIEHRGKFSAAMIYDNQPIIDVFRKMDTNTVLGMMEMKGMKKPFFFVLKRNT